MLGGPCGDGKNSWVVKAVGFLSQNLWALWLGVEIAFSVTRFFFQSLWG